MDIVRRYPGARPFGDSETDRKGFRGRETDTLRLLKLVLAERLVTVFSRSGLGKTSLLRCGLAEPLRHEGFVPVFVRLAPVGSLAGALEESTANAEQMINDVRAHGRLVIRQALEQAAENYRLDLIEGTGDDIAEWLNSTEMWHEDDLLRPVLIFDQFEELFTLHAHERRHAIVEELAALAGYATSFGSGSGCAREAAVKLIIAIREDYLAELDELTRGIPTILSTRFRLTALTVEQARAAIAEPAKIVDARLNSPPFRWDEAALQAVLSFLSKGRNGEAGRGIEPFQLQLVCHHAESLVLAADAFGGRKTTIEVRDLGSEKRIKQILSGFYEGVLDKAASVSSLSGKRLRVRTLSLFCQEGLITSTGNRRMLEAGDIIDRFRVLPHELDELVERRLLRREPRGRAQYYELSHDALVQPILDHREELQARHKRRIRAWTRLLGGVVLLSVGLLALLYKQQTDRAQRLQELQELQSKEAVKAFERMKNLEEKSEQVDIIQQALKVDTGSALIRKDNRWVAQIWLEENEGAGHLEGVSYTVLNAEESAEGPTEPILGNPDRSFCATIDVDGIVLKDTCPLIEARLRLTSGETIDRVVRPCGDRSSPNSEFFLAVPTTMQNLPPLLRRIERGMQRRGFEVIVLRRQVLRETYYVALNSAQNTITQDEWKAYIKSLNVPEHMFAWYFSAAKYEAGASYSDEIYPMRRCSAASTESEELRRRMEDAAASRRPQYPDHAPASGREKLRPRTKARELLPGTLRTDL